MWSSGPQSHYQARPQNVVIEFESMEKALACYYSPEYQAAKLQRDGNEVADLMIIEGTDNDVAFSPDIVIRY
ncbi:DUF1330 domain-containing protein [Pseudomonas sp. 10B1]|uniref:DUF1330 domain-containing protein n=1 Tax=unclassified Pseudomonas TaxID=196821 RepID=UPI002AB45210|nr:MULTISPECIES: DUF1330 domain-containing protein [unclassified Pseudomonas]MDY7560918.1 DUF1330 domain-containing protein [Pseudomonas sp. AB6]MEA9976431.1 DUF1330 domain-containing protein [Pseudomonas sp. RTS4]MEA9996946.1 DUF1330 domain-containing protein [Pseudomonas sp. AA4]MEB0087003.1 DUF1330 domain-containing protein [Pseudomonas sp. RTI1]MEB0126730.1 DUF1330 domain-containing protein [Pseudomonas sp. CCC1.2]